MWQFECGRQVTHHPRPLDPPTTGPVTTMPITGPRSSPQLSRGGGHDVCGHRLLDPACPATGYRLPEFPKSFASLVDARQFCAGFFHEYNYVHRHSGIAWHTPASVHFGTAGTVAQARQN